MLWVIQENIANEDKFNSLIESIQEIGDKVQLVKVVPFVGDIIPDVDCDGDVICFGSYSMRHTAVEKGWSPGVFDIDWFPYTSLIEELGNQVLNHDAIVGKFGEIDPSWDEFFIRPTHDGKEFAGTVETRQRFRDWQLRVVELGLQNTVSTLGFDTEVLCASLKRIDQEYRFFIVNGKVSTGSRYKLGKRVVYEEAYEHDEAVAQTFADQLAHRIPFPYVLDLSYTDGEWKVIELNTMNCAGFYACDVQKLVFDLNAC